MRTLRPRLRFLCAPQSCRHYFCCGHPSNFRCWWSLHGAIVFLLQLRYQRRNVFSGNVHNGIAVVVKRALLSNNDLAPVVLIDGNCGLRCCDYVRVLGDPFKVDIQVLTSSCALSAKALRSPEPVTRNLRHDRHASVCDVRDVRDAFSRYPLYARAFSCSKPEEVS